MDSEDIIELSSSPGPPPPPALSSRMRSKRALRRRANATKQACQPALDKDVLEITDTETEPDDLERDLLLLRVDKGKGKGKENVQDEHVTCVPTDTTMSPRGSGRYDSFFINDDSPVPEIFAEGPLVTLPNQLVSTSRLAPSRTSYEDPISHKGKSVISSAIDPAVHDESSSLNFPDTPFASGSKQTVPHQQRDALPTLFHSDGTLDNLSLLTYVKQVQDFIPDADPAWVKILLRTHCEHHGAQLLEAVIQDLLDASPPLSVSSTSQQAAKRKLDDDLVWEEVPPSKRRAPSSIGNQSLVAGPSGERGGASTSVKNPEAGPSTEAEFTIECGCCFDSYPFDQMVQCPEAHLFCTDCVRSYTSTRLGDQTIDIYCMDGSGCKALFPECELRRILDGKLMSLYDRLSAQVSIDKAKIEGLEECPFCDYKCVIENDQEKLFRCGEPACLKITCRACKKLDHLPKSCKEVTDDQTLDAQHAVEEAMSRAMVRNCPQCSKPFVKQDGCNKISCTYCHTLSCYVCRKVITGYDHFNSAHGHDPTRSNNDKRCPLWDNTDNRHDTEVKNAAEQALAKFKADNPDADASKFKLDIPKPAPGPSNHRGAHAHAALAHHRHLPARAMLPQWDPAHAHQHGWPAHGGHEEELRQQGALLARRLAHLDEHRFRYQANPEPPVAHRADMDHHRDLYRDLLRPFQYGVGPPANGGVLAHGGRHARLAALPLAVAPIPPIAPIAPIQPIAPIAPVPPIHVDRHADLYRGAYDRLMRVRREAEAVRMLNNVPPAIRARRHAPAAPLPAVPIVDPNPRARAPARRRRR